MEQYVSKAALVTEIKARIETYNKGYANGDYCRADALETFLHDIDSLEVKEVKEAKEVDLEKEIELLKEDYEQVDVAWNNDFDYIARYFFELGLNFQTKDMQEALRIEYEKGRADVIGKACEFLKDIFEEYENLTDYNPTEDFKNYMNRHES